MLKSLDAAAYHPHSRPAWLEIANRLGLLRRAAVRVHDPAADNMNLQEYDAMMGRVGLKSARRDDHANSRIARGTDRDLLIGRRNDHPHSR